MKKTFIFFLLIGRVMASSTCDSLLVHIRHDDLKETESYQLIHQYFHDFFAANDRADIDSCTWHLLSMPELRSDQARAAVTSELRGLSFYYNNQYDSAFLWFDKSLRLAVKSGLTEYILSNHLYKGKVLSIHGYYGKALMELEDYIRIAKDQNHTDKLPEGYNSMALIYEFKGNFLKAYGLFDQSRQIDEENGNLKGLSWDYANIARNYIKRDNYTEALDYYNKSLQISNLLGLPAEKIEYIIDQEEQMSGEKQLLLQMDLDEPMPGNEYSSGMQNPPYDQYLDLGFIYFAQGKYLRALKNFDGKFREAEKNRDDPGMVNALIDQGMIYTELEQYTQAMERYEKALIISERIGYKRGISECYKSIGVIKIKQEDFDDALKWCELAYNLSDEMGLMVLEKQASECLYQASKSMGEGMQALNYYEVFALLDDSLLSENSAGKIQEKTNGRRWIIDSISMERDKLQSKIEYKESLYKARNLRNVFMFTGIGVLLIAGGLFSRVRFVRRTNRELEEKNRIIAEAKEKTEESKRFKDRFFANISHEFRTPLTLIRGPLKEMYARIDNPALREDLAIIDRNATRMHTLVDQLLSLSKIDSRQIQMCVERIDLVTMARLFVQSFEPIAKLRNIEFVFQSAKEEYPLYIDTVKMEQVLGNLLSNAFKYVENGGRVSIAIRDHMDQQSGEKGVEVSVSDTGCGIPEAWHEKIFDRFSQVEGKDRPFIEGTGIGLALSRELVKLHGGRIWVESETGNGSAFHVFLPFGKDHFPPDIIVYENTGNPSRGSEEWSEGNRAAEVIPVCQEVESMEHGPVNPDQPVLLIVEDNRDMTRYIRSFFKDDYCVVSAGDGVSGLKKAFELIPDIIITDLMMPDMDGNELCSRIKEDERTSHIPVIMLTAHAGMETRLKGLETGADDFMVKPFDAEELIVRVRNLIHRKQKLMEAIRHQLGQQDPLLFFGSSMVESTSMDEKFLKKLVEVLEENYSNPDFSVTELSEKMNMHRVNLHRKLKALTGQTASDMIRDIRLKKAAHMLSARAGHVSQIAFDVGFSNLSYFAKTFKAQFSLSPSEYLKKASSTS